MDEVLINANASRLPPAIGTDGESGFVVVWSDLFGTGLRGRRLLASGVTSGEEFSVNTTTGGTHSLPAVTLLGGFDPGFAITWIAEEALGPSNVLLQRFARDGTRTGVEIQVNTTEINPSFRPAIARLADLNFVVSWVSAREGIRAQIFKPNGARLGPEFRVDTSDELDIGPVLLAPLTNNSFVIAWRSGLTLATTTAHLQIFEPTGSKVGPEKIPNFNQFTGEMAMTFISNPSIGADSRFVIAHVTFAGGGEERLVEASIFSSNGDKVVTFTVTRREDQSIARELAAAALPGRRFLVAWTDLKVPPVGDTTGKNVKAMLCSDEKGALISSAVPAIPVNTTIDGDQTAPCVATTVVPELGELIALAWIDNSASGSSSGHAVKARVLPKVGSVLT